MASHLRDEHGNPVELTDELGRPVKLTDEHGHPIHLTGVAFSSSDTTAPITNTTPNPTGMQSSTPLGAGVHGPRSGPHVHETLGEVLEGGGQYQPRRDHMEGMVLGGGAAEIHHHGPRAGPHVHETLGEVLEGGQYQPRRDHMEGTTVLGGGSAEIQSPSSSSSEGDEGLGEGPERTGRRRKKKGLGEKIKEKLMGGSKNNKDKEEGVFETATTTITTTTTTSLEHHEDDHKKGFMEKIKEKIPGTGHH